jgi:hypothetical protein
MTRLFTFGCSFTRGLYPTWADIVARQYDHYQNWAQAGAGNSFIFYSLTECHKRNRINKDDVVMIMWSNIGREDRYINGKWLTPGSIYNQTEYDAAFVNKFADPTGYLLRDAAHLSAAKHLLDNIGCSYTFFSIVPFDVPDDNVFKIFSMDRRITKLYQKEFDCVRASVYQTVFDYDWYSKSGPKRPDKLKQEYQTKKGQEWPAWEQFEKQDWTDVPKHIQNEINEENNFHRRHMIRYDTHPTPLEYLEYLQKVAPEITIDSETQQWVKRVTDAIFDMSDIKQLWQSSPTPTRF